MQYIGPMMDALRYTILAQQECQKVSWTTTVIFLPQYKTHKKSAHHTIPVLSHTLHSQHALQKTVQEAPHPHPLSQKTPFHPANNNSCICVVCVCSIKSCRYWCFSPKSKGATEDVEGCWSHDGRLALHYHSKNAKWFLGLRL